MDLSIVIVNWNTKSRLAACLDSVERHPPEGELEVIVVDNDSSDGSAQMARECFSDVTLIEQVKNVGYAEGNNRGIRASTGRLVLLLNPDTEVKAGTLDALVKFVDEHPEAAAVGCRLVGSDGRVQRSCRSFPDPAGVLFEYTRLSYLFPKSRLFGRYRMTYFRYNQEAEVDQPMGSCLLMSRKAIEDVDMFDQEFPIFFNEVDWCYRAKLKGWKIYFTPSAEVVHHGAASTSQIKAEMIRESHRSMLKFYDKHYKGSISGPVYWLISASISINSFFASRLASIGR